MAALPIKKRKSFTPQEDPQYLLSSKDMKLQAGRTFHQTFLADLASMPRKVH
jgi:hypothetical protein